MASSISSGSGQASPARRARCRQSITVDAPIDRLAAILRLDMPAAVNRSTSRILRMGNLAPGIAPLPVEKEARPLGFADHPTVLVHTPPHHPQLLGIARNNCSGSIGMLLGISRNGCARDQWESLLGITRCAHIAAKTLTVTRNTPTALQRPQSALPVA